MEPERGERSMKSLVWGVFLIVIGGAFLLDRLHVVNLPSIEEFWPLVFVVIGTIHFLERRPGSAVTFILMGAWFMACTTGWNGFTYGNSWPVLLIAVGTGIVLRALTGEDARRRRGGEERHG
jgi:hypothetical protein